MESKPSSVQMMLDQMRFTMTSVAEGTGIEVSGRLEHLEVHLLEEIPPDDPRQPKRLLVAVLVPDEEMARLEEVAKLADAA